MSSLITLGDHRKYHLYRKETDMRKGFDSLCGIVGSELGKQVMDGDAFIFISKPRTHLKLLVWEKAGLHFFIAGWKKERLKFLFLILMQRACRSLQIN